MMIYHEGKDGKPYYNFQYFDQLIDFLLSAGLRPILELSMAPTLMATGQGTVFWWKANITPPKDYRLWTDLASETIIHSINRYGLDEVRQWYFEIWNEPCIIDGFWSGTPEQFYELYRDAYFAVKRVDGGLRVGAPAHGNDTGQQYEFYQGLLDYCEQNGCIPDFITPHPYPNDWPLDNGKVVMTYDGPDRTYHDMNWIKATRDVSPYSKAEIHCTEWNASPSPRDLVHDTAFMAPFIIQNNLRCMGLADSLCFWTFTDIFEELGAGDTPFHGGFGLINVHGLKKSAYYGYLFLNKLGDTVIAQGDDYIVCRNADGIQILMWNYVHYKESFARGDRSLISVTDRYNVFLPAGDKHFYVSLDGVEGEYRMTEYILDRDNGSVYDHWVRQGGQNNLTEEEVEYLDRMSGPATRFSVREFSGRFAGEYGVSPHGVTMVTLKKVFRP